MRITVTIKCLFLLLSVFLLFSSFSSAQSIDGMLVEARKLFEAEEITRAIALYQKILGMDAKNTAALIGLGDCSAHADKIPDALGYYDTAIACNPNQVTARLRKARVLANTGKIMEALELCDQAISMAPGDINTYYEKLNVLHALDANNPALAKERYDEALECAEKGLQNQPMTEAEKYTRSEIQSIKGRFLFKQEKYADALKTFDQVKSSRPLEYYELTIVGQIHEKMGDYEQAETYYKESLALSPSGDAEKLLQNLPKQK